MARAVARVRDLLCHTCKHRWSAMVWGYDENWTKPREPITCPNFPTTCSAPHIEVLPNWRRTGRSAQARAEQRSAVYLMPNGQVAVPATNRYDDEIAVDAVLRGGVRHEFPSVRSMQAFQRQRRRTDDDEFTDRCMVIDHDQSTILRGDTLLREGLRREDESRRELYENDTGVYFGREKYDQLREQFERERESGRSGNGNRR